MSRRRILVAFVMSIILPLVGAIRPLQNLQVSCHDRTYSISDVSTVDELLLRLQQRISQGSDNVRVIYKGRMLNLRDNLRDVGVLDGSHLMVLTDNNRMKVKEFLALFLAMISEEGWDRFRRELQEHPEALNDLHMKLQYLKCVSSDDVYDCFRNTAIDSYHQLRSWWENPSFRSSLRDEEEIEAYRKVFSFHLSPKIVNDIPWVKKTIHSPSRWRQEVSRVADTILRGGDVVLDSILAMLLDVLRGTGKSAATTRTGEFAQSTTKHQSSSSEDPHFEELLFELSDSDSEA